MSKTSRNALDGDIIAISPGLAIYKVKASPFWQVRIRDPRIKRYVVRSTKETSRIQARAAAREMAYELLGNEKRVEREFTFRYYASRLIAKGERLIALGERNANPDFVIQTTYQTDCQSKKLRQINAFHILEPNPKRPARYNPNWRGAFQYNKSYNTHNSGESVLASVESDIFEVACGI